ncbi:O-antigen polysaccharide polymerase Wzy family protein, partial [Vibrio cholerae]|uniref:O-antigen polysaccharide polymerase Wzy family protein n=1 Tax=Vibrio cholerae TaxID=666 RepID=UPI00215F5065
LMTYLVIGIISLDLGYKVARLSNKVFPDIKINHEWMRNFSIFSLCLAPLFMIETVFQIRDAISGGYLSSKLWQTKAYSFPLSSLAQTIFGICFGYSMAFGYKRKVFIAIFIFGVIGSLLVGARGPIITALLLYLWIKGNNGQKRINVLKLFSLGLIVVVSVSYFIQMYSFRTNEEKFEFDFFIFLADFLYNQGISVMVFDVSMKVTDYPILAYFQSLFPGASALASLIFPVEYYMTGFQHYMARELDPDLFSLGFGLDWTLFSDFYVFGGESILGFAIVGFLFGYLLSVLQNSSHLEFWSILLFALFTRIMFLPRSSLSVIFPFIF